MHKFSYIGYKTNGERVTGELEAGSEKTAEATLWKSDITVVSIKEKKRVLPPIQELLPSLYAIKTEEIVNLNRDLYTLLNAGIGIYPSLTMLYERTSKVSMKSLIQDILQSVESGSSFSEACGKHPKLFSPFYIRMTKVGEEIGNLEQMLQQISIQMTKEAAIKRKIKGAMTYPMIVLVFAVLAVIGLMTFLIPAMKGLFEQMGGELPFLTKVMVVSSDFVTGNILPLGIGLFLIIGCTAWFFRTAQGKRAKDTMKMKTPIFKEVNLKGAMARTTRNMALLLGGGISITDALDLIVQTSDNYILKEAFQQLRTDVNDGLLLSQALKNQDIFPTLISQVVGVGELTGKLEPNLVSIADFYETETDRAVASMTTMLTPIMTVVIGGIVACIALAMYQPMYGIAGQLEQQK
ncbi:MAG: type II secretion system F family protein [Dehalococcoidia bacterium]|jgi:type IV pilus assembly protein PilC